MDNLPDTEKSYWREFYPSQAVYPELLEDIAVDVAIVGAGITGMTAAYLLKKSGFTVAVLDKHTVGGGTTGRTTGKVTSQHGLNYHGLQKRFDAKTARIYGEANQAAIEQIEKIVAAENMDCDWQRDDNYVFTADPKRAAQFRQ